MDDKKVLTEGTDRVFYRTVTAVTAFVMGGCSDVALHAFERWDHQHRAGCVSNHSFGDASNQKIMEGAAPACAHHYHVGLYLVRLFDDDLIGNAKKHLGSAVRIALDDLGGYAGQISAASFCCSLISSGGNAYWIGSITNMITISAWLG